MSKNIVCNIIGRRIVRGFFKNSQIIHRFVHSKSTINIVFSIVFTIKYLFNT
jgi:hypothetical protein